MTKKAHLTARGISLEVTTLLDTGANGEAFINTRFYKPIKERLGPTFYKLSQGVQVTGHNNQPTDTLRRAF